jgi:hypothetical protein
MATTRDPIDMSETAIGRRLDDVRALYALVLSLRRIRLDEARPAGSVPSRR